MPNPSDARVAVYIDFDNIVISRYVQKHPAFRGDQLNQYVDDADHADMTARLQKATVDIGAVLDYATSFGSIVISRAYADWSLPVNSRYQRDLISRSVDLTQLFPTAGTKNGADIRLAVDVMEDLFQLTTISHVVIVAGDSDYISLAQRAKRLGRFVVGIGVAGSTSHSLADACNEFADYDALPGVKQVVKPPARQPAKAATPATKEKTVTKIDPKLQSARDKAAVVLERALRVLHEKSDDEWLHSPAVKEQMKRMDPQFSEKALDFSSFTEFLKSRGKVVDVKETGQLRMLRLHQET